MKNPGRLQKAWLEQARLWKKDSSNVKKQSEFFVKRGLAKEEIHPQFIAQPSKSVQRMTSTNPATEAIKVRWEKGASLDMYDEKWIEAHKLEITKQVARSLADLNLRHGVVHQDLHDGNVIAYQSKSGKISVKFIDFEYARTIKGDDEKFKDGGKMHKPLEMEFQNIRRTITSMGKTEEEKKMLWKMFLSEYEKVADSL